MAITAKELAAMLGLSAAAVSMALNGKPGVSESTRERVLQVAREQNFDFSKIRDKEAADVGTLTFLIYKRHGAVVGDTPFFAALSDSVADVCHSARYRLNIRYLYEENVERDLRALLAEDIRGVLLLGTEMRPEAFRPFSDFPLPMVILDTYFEGIERDCVLINNMQGAYIATNHLIAKRKQQPGYLRSSYSIGNFEERADGFYKAIRHNGMATGASIVHRLAPSVEGAYADMKTVIEQREPLAECYFADNDLIAAGAMRALKEAGYHVPRDIGVVGFDNIPMCESLDPPLTTVHVPKQILGRLAVEQLVQKVNAPTGWPVKIEVETTLVQRGSL